MMTPHPNLKAIVAMARNRVIGKDGVIPWRISDELRWFKTATTGHTVLMGRKTWQSLGRPLPNRRNLVLTTTETRLDGAEIIRSLDEFNPDAYNSDVFIMGGGEIYRQLLPKCSELWLTRVFLEPEGDTVFPDFEGMFTFREILLVHPEFEVHRYVHNDLPAL